MKENKKKLSAFLKKNALYVFFALCVLAIGLSTTLMLVGDNSNSLEVPDTPIIKPDQPDDSDQTNAPSDDPSDSPTNNPGTTEPDQPTSVPVVFIMPIENSSSITDFSDTMVFNSTLNRYTSHKAVDFFAPEGTEVLATYDGVVDSVESNLLTGITIRIDHGNGLMTVYNSLSDSDLAHEGQVVKRGDVIGYVSNTNRQEYKAGAHLHFEVLESGQNIDPSKYLVFVEK